MLQKLRKLTRAQRLKRFNAFLSDSNEPLRIVDLGGTVKFWEDWGLSKRPNLDVTVVNSHHQDRSHANDAITLPNIHRLFADVLTLSADDLAKYDLIFSNSLIEHLPGPRAQHQLAAAIVASGRPYFLQTPNKRSPLDPHFPKPYVPFFAAYPRPVQARLLTWSALGSSCAAASYEEALERLRNYYPLTKRDVRELFPKARVVVERPLGVPMSIIAQSDPSRRAQRNS